MDTSGSPDLIVEKFNQMHADWGIELPPRSTSPAGELRQDGGSGLVRYVYGEDERGHYLEYYSYHRIWGDVHQRVYESGEVEWLSILETALPVTDDPEADKQRLKEQQQQNLKLLRQLDEAELLSGGPVPKSFQINAALASGAISPDEPEDERSG